MADVFGAVVDLGNPWIAQAVISGLKSTTGLPSHGSTADAPACGCGCRAICRRLGLSVNCPDLRLAPNIITDCFQCCMCYAPGIEEAGEATSQHTTPQQYSYYIGWYVVSSVSHH